MATHLQVLYFTFLFWVLCPTRQQTYQGDIRTMKKTLLAVLILLLSHTGLQAEQYKLDEIQNRGIADDIIKCKWKNQEGVPCIKITKFVLRDPSVLTTASMSVDYIDQYTIENTNTIDTVQAISRITGLNVVQSGPTGQQTSVFMRGMNSNHTMVAINGVAIKDHSTTGGLHDIGADFIKHVTGIQVVKGSQGTLYGANAVGGVINFITTDSYANSISTTLGSNNTKGITLKIHRDVNNHSISIIADGTTSDGISVAPSGTEKDGFDANNITINTKSKWDEVEIQTTLIRRESDADLDSGTGDDLDLLELLGSFSPNRPFPPYPHDHNVPSDLVAIVQLPPGLTVVHVVPGT